MHVVERGWLSSNAIFFDGESGPTIVDTGYCSHSDLTLALVRRAFGGRPLAHIVNTHLHSDHCGGNAALQAAYPDASTRLPIFDADAVRDWDAARLTFDACGQRCPRFGFDATYAPGDIVMLGDLPFVAVAAPGHDPRMCVLWCESERVLISADALWEDGFGVVFPEIEGEPGFADVRATLDVIARLDAALVVPGHGAPFEGVRAALARAYARLDRFERDPSSNARNAVKVLIKFALLDRQSIALPALPPLLASMRYIDEVRSRFMPEPVDELARWVAEALVKAGAATIDGNVLRNTP